jgi:hypothetical protein
MPRPQLAIVVELGGVSLIVGRVHDRHVVRQALDRAIGEAESRARHRGPLAAAAADAEMKALRCLVTQLGGGDVNAVDVPQTTVM